MMENGFSVVFCFLAMFKHVSGRILYKPSDTKESLHPHIDYSMVMYLMLVSQLCFGTLGLRFFADCLQPSDVLTTRLPRRSNFQVHTFLCPAVYIITSLDVTSAHHEIIHPQCYNTFEGMDNSDITSTQSTRYRETPLIRNFQISNEITLINQSCFCIYDPLISCNRSRHLSPEGRFQTNGVRTNEVSL